MPAQITHILAGEEALTLPGLEDVRRIVSLYPAHFRLGCQGPDIFYHNQRTRPSGLHFGALLHKRNYGRMLAAVAVSFGAAGIAGAAAARGEAVAEKGMAHHATLSFFLGVSTHAATDRALHPFIIHFSGRTEHKQPETERFAGCHAFLERLVDMALLKRYRNMNPESFGIASSMDILGNPETACPDILTAVSPETRTPAGNESGRIDAGHSDRQPHPEVHAETIYEILSRPWETGIRAAFPRSTTDDLFVRKRILNAFDDARRFYALTDPARTNNCRVQFARFAGLPDREKMRMASLLYPHYPEGIPPDLDFMNQGKRMWLHPSGDGRSSNADGFSLFRDAIAQSACCMLAFSDFMTGVIDSYGLETAIGNGGLGSCERDGSPSSGNALAPLPLEAFLRCHSESILPS